MNNENAENHNWRNLPATETAYRLAGMPEIGSKDSIPFFLHGKYVERFWRPTIEGGDATLYFSSCDVMRITVELDLLLVSIEDNEVIGLHYPEIA